MKKLLSIIMSIVIASSAFLVPLSAFAEERYVKNWNSKAATVELNKTYYDMSCDSTDNYICERNTFGGGRCDVFKITLPIKSTLVITSTSLSYDYFTNDSYIVFSADNLYKEIIEINSGLYDYTKANGLYTQTKTVNLNAGTYYIAKYYFYDINDYSEPYDISFSFKGAAIISAVKKKKAVVLKWRRQQYVTGYQIQYSTSKKFAAKKTKIVSVKKATTTKRTIKKLKSKKKYYIRIRSYKVLNGKTYYSSWSKSKAVKTK